MLGNKQWALIIGGFLLSVNYGLTQQTTDIGNFITTSDIERIGIEFRKPIKQQYWLKMGLTYGSNNNSYYRDNRQIIFVSDTLITERVKYTSYQQGGIRIGAERRFRTSMFTVGADLNINYRKTKRLNLDRFSVLKPDNSWSNTNSYYTEFSKYDDPSGTRMTQHFIVPNLRISFNMYAPLGKSFLLHLFAAGSFGTPIYMGATNVNDPQNEFLGTPPSVFDFEQQIGIGLRYIFGKKEG